MSFDRKSIGQKSFSQNVMGTSVGQNVRTCNVTVNRTAYIIHQCRITTVLSCHRCLINPVLKNEQHFNIEQNFDHQMSLSKSKCLYSNICLHFLKHQPCYEKGFQNQKSKLLKIVNNCLNTETSCGQISNQNLYLLLFSTQMLIRYLGQLKTVVLLHWCLIGAVLLTFSQDIQPTLNQMTLQNFL